MNFTTGRKLGKTLCDALGLDANDIHTISIHCEPMGAATVVVEKYVSVEVEGEINRCIREFAFDLVERDPPVA